MNTFLRLKRCLFLAVAIFGFSLSTVIAQNSIQYNLVSTNDESTQIRFDLKDFELKTSEVNGVTYTSVHMDKGADLLEKGSPDLSRSAVSIILPDHANMSVEVIGGDYQEYQNINIAPSKGMLYRNILPNDIAVEYGDVYQEDAFYPGHLSTLGNPYILRDYRGQAVRFYPFQYNPVSKVLRVYSNIEVKIQETEGEVINEFNRTRAVSRIADDFDQIYSNHFLNYSEGEYRYTEVAEGGKMLIIAPASLQSAMQPFITWKKEKGIQCEMVDVATVGNNRTAIASYIADYYNANTLNYVLLVGDDADVRSHDADYDNQNGVSDPKYGFITGNDVYPEVFVGRFSSSSASDISTMVSRTIEYEKTPPTNGDWYKTAIGIASNEGAGQGDNGEADWDHMRRIRTDLQAYTFGDVAELYDGSQGGEDAAGYPSASDVSVLVNSGVSLINYAGHGDDQSCVTTNFSNGDVNSLTNTGKYPYFISVACDNGKFANTTAFAEHWLRATDNSGNPTGAIGALMSSILMAWTPPMLAQDEMMDILTDQETVKSKHIGGVTFNGLAAMVDGYGSQSYECVETWLLFGDPSTMLWTDVPAAMSVNHDDWISEMATEITVSCDIEGALVSITQDGEILGTGIASGGSVTISIAISGGTDVLVTATAFNHSPSQSTLVVSGVGVSELGASKLTLAPNPTQDRVVLSSNILLENATIQIFDQVGKIVKAIQSTVSNSGTSIDVSGFSAGMYIMKVTLNGESTIQKLMIK